MQYVVFVVLVAKVYALSLILSLQMAMTESSF